MWKRVGGGGREGGGETLRNDEEWRGQNYFPSSSPVVSAAPPFPLLTLPSSLSLYRVLVRLEFLLRPPYERRRLAFPPRCFRYSLCSDASLSTPPFYHPSSSFLPLALRTLFYSIVSGERKNNGGTLRAGKKEDGSSPFVSLYRFLEIKRNLLASFWIL